MMLVGALIATLLLGSEARLLHRNNQSQDGDSCEDFTVAGCAYSANDVLWVSDQVNSAELCQFTCDAFAECLLFRFSYGGSVMTGQRSGGLGNGVKADTTTAMP